MNSPAALLDADIPDRRPRVWSGSLSPLVLIVVATGLLRLMAAAALGLGVDESYMVAAGRHLHLSYFDHPPLAWWLQWAAVHLLGSDAPFVVRLPFVALFALSTWLMHRLTLRVFEGSPMRERAAFWAVVLFNLAPVFGVTTASWVLPDGPLNAALLGLLLCLVAAMGSSRQPWRWWLGAGLCAGLALLSKYTAVLTLAGAAAAVLTNPGTRRWVRRPEPWIAVLLAAALCTLVVVWNATHGWASFAFQGGRAVGLRWHPFAPLLILGGESLFLMPWIGLPLLFCLVAALRRGRADWPGWLLACCALPFVVLFAVVGLWSSKPVLFHWAAPGYLMLFPLLGATVAALPWRWRRRVGWVAVGSAVTIVLGAALIGSEVQLDWLPNGIGHYQMEHDPDLAVVDWTSLRTEMQSRGWLGAGRRLSASVSENSPLVAALNWHDTGKIAYALGSTATVFCLCNDAREFGIIRPAASFAGRSVLVLAPLKPAAAVVAKLRRRLLQVEPEATLTILHHGMPASLVPVFRGIVPATPAPR